MKNSSRQVESGEIAALEQVGGHPALDFVNTVQSWREAEAGPAANDYLHSYDDFIDWGLAAGVMWPNSARHFKALPAAEKAEAFEWVVKLRHALHEVFAQLATNRPISQGSLDYLNDIVRRTAAWRRLAGDTETKCRTICCTWDFSDAPAIAAVGSIAWDAANLLEHGRLERIKECPGERCGWLFLDESRNRSRTWCSMKTCGNTAKVKRFREKQG